MTEKNKGIVKKNYKPIYVTLLLLLPLLFFLLIFIFWLLDKSLLNTDVGLYDSFSSHEQEILVLSISLYALAFYYIVSSFHIKEPTKTDTLASSKWKTIDEQKAEFGIAPIDTSATLSVGGAPINKISETEILYETASMHDLTMGITRSGKSRKIVRQLVMIASMAKESMIFNDPKKEMYQDFHIYLEKAGYDVYVLDFRKPETSNAWNPLDDINYMVQLGNIDDADQYAEDQVTSLVVDNGNTEPIWVEGQKALIKALILEVTQAKIPKDKKNYYSIVQTLSVLGQEMKIDGTSKMLLSVYMDSLDETSPSRVSYTPVSNAPDKTRGSFVSSALATLHPFTAQKLMKVLSHSDFDFHDFKDGKKALFVVNPDEKKTYNAITAMVYDNAYQSLIYEANQLSGRSLKKRVHMIFDEFGNMPKISMLETKLTVSLARNILYHLYLQDFKQMNEKYGDNIASIIRGNCALWYFISSGDYDTCEEMSKKLGEETIWVQNQGGNFNDQSNTTGGNIGYNQQTRRLLNANELLESDMRDGHGIIVYRTYLGPCRVELPDCTSYSWYSEMQHDETEVVNEDLKLSYAIPRYVVIDMVVLQKHGIPYQVEDGEIVIAKRGELVSKNMYWYWSTRDDLEGSVLLHIMDWLKATNTKPTRKEIKKYMKSDEFIEWLWSIDKVESDEVDASLIESAVDEKCMNETHDSSDTVFTDLWG